MARQTSLLAAHRDSRLTGTPPEALVVLSAISLYAGAAVAVSLFDYLQPQSVAWIRVAGAALVLLAWRRPWRVSWTRERLLWAAAFGATLAVMNLMFYLAVEHLHLGTAVAIEFLGPISVAVFFSRSQRNALALAVAIAGVALLSEVSASGQLEGVGFALVAATLWAGYILLGSRVATQGAALDGLGLGMCVGAIVIAPAGLPWIEPVIDRPWLIAAGVAVGLLSNVVPYGLDQVAFRRVPPGRFALLLALLPATATLAGFIALGQVPSGAEAAGIALVIGAIAIRDRAGERVVA